MQHYTQKTAEPDYLGIHAALKRKPFPYFSLTQHKIKPAGYFFTDTGHSNSAKKGYLREIPKIHVLDKKKFPQQAINKCSDDIQI